MSLFWLVYNREEEIGVVIVEASSLIDARMRAALDGLEACEFTEGHQLDAKISKRVPRKMVGRRLTAPEAKRLLKRLDSGR